MLTINSIDSTGKARTYAVHDDDTIGEIELIYAFGTFCHGEIIEARDEKGNLVAWITWDSNANRYIGGSQCADRPITGKVSYTHC